MSPDAVVIPRIIHRIWLGGQPMPDEFGRYGETWREHHPGWEMRLWTEDNLPPLKYPDALDRGRHHGERANVVRYEVLRQFGGVYVDADMECLRSIEPLLPGVEAFAGYQRPGELCNAVLGCVPHHPAFERAVEETLRRVGTGRSSVAATGPGFITELLTGFPGVTLFGPETFYPYDWEEEPRPASELPEAYAIHHWSRQRGEPEDPEAKIEFLRERLAEARRRRAKFRRKATKLEHEALASRKRADRLEARLNALEASLWWRLSPGRLVSQLRRSRTRR